MSANSVADRTRRVWFGLAGLVTAWTVTTLAFPSVAGAAEEFEPADEFALDP